MKAMVNTSANVLEMRDMPMPQPGEGQVRIRTTSCGICATDLVMIAGWERTPFGAIPGHEWTGVVDSAGPEVDRGLIGKTCVGDNVQKDGGEAGFEYPGGYASYFLTEAKNVLVLPDTADPASAVLIEPLAVAVRGFRRMAPTAGSGVLIFGDGPIGLLLLMLLKRTGHGPVYLVGGRPDRLKLAGELGADGSLNYHDAVGDPASAICTKLDMTNVNCFAEASGSTASLSASIDLARAGAKLLVIGDYGHSTASFPWNTILHKELSIIGSNASAGAWQEAVAIASEPTFKLSRLITHRLPAERFAEGLALMRSRTDNVIKVILEWRNS